MPLKDFIKLCLEFLSRIVITSILLLLCGVFSFLVLSIPILLFDWIFSTEIMSYLTDFLLFFSLTVSLIIIGILGIPLFIYKDASRFVVIGEKD